MLYLFKINVNEWICEINYRAHIKVLQKTRWLMERSP